MAGEDNAAVELIEEGVNGFVAASDSPEDLAAGDRRRSMQGAPRCVSPPRRGSPPTRAACRSARSQELVVEVYDSGGVR